MTDLRFPVGRDAPPLRRRRLTMTEYLAFVEFGWRNLPKEMRFRDPRRDLPVGQPFRID
ncbi:MAG: hypothetical protein V1809_13640 [Planctomycetota bacterium]